jgi:hypothetical protein
VTRAPDLWTWQQDQHRTPLRQGLRSARNSLLCFLGLLVGLWVGPGVNRIVHPVPPAAAAVVGSARAERLVDRVQVATQAHRCEPVTPYRSPLRPPGSVLVYHGGRLQLLPAGRVVADRALLGSAVAWCGGDAGS